MGMRRRMVHTFAVCLMAAAVMLSGCAAPAIPHATEGRSDCLSCHGQTSVKPYPQWHAERALSSESCAACHKPRDGPKQQGG
jgi:hypothetical protein